ncbi:piercer of microtubule wall 2 protein [Sitodiplosis mosellana]|uniref:piercer of microtubule wall 2 protein n=1 Tax=Sitodiplosis mosellana TaxID=263140 RepID=UPI002444E33E|nr:piercer of microtubule wall 2 protein [Sitodiplosis mosellana]
MVKKCTCLGCQNIANRTKKPNRRGDCVPTEAYNSRFDRENRPDEYSEKCIPKLNNNINKRYERDVKTSDLYRTLNIPDRFERSCTLNGYGSQYKTYHPVFRTTNSDYGWTPPNAHTVPHSYYPRTNEFSDLLAKTGMYRNYSLNTVMDKSRVF